jgi:hypothetical protein
MATNWNQFLTDVFGVLKQPGQTLGRLMKEKNWVLVFLLLMVVVGLFTYFAFPAQMAKMAKNPQFAEMLEDRGALLSPDSGFARLLGSFMALFGLFLSLVFGAFFLYLFFGIGGSEGDYSNYFSIVVNASIIDILLPLLLSAVSLLAGANLAAVATPLIIAFSPEVNSLQFLVLARFNVFAIWYLVAVAAGISAFSKMSFKKCMTISVFYFLFKAAVGISFSYLFIKISSTQL